MRRRTLTAVVIGALATLTTGAWFTSWTSPRSFVPKVAMDTDRPMSARRYNELLPTYPQPHVAKRVNRSGSLTPLGGAK